MRVDEPDRNGNRRNHADDGQNKRCRRNRNRAISKTNSKANDASSMVRLRKKPDAIR